MTPKRKARPALRVFDGVAYQGNAKIAEYCGQGVWVRTVRKFDPARGWYTTTVPVSPELAKELEGLR